MSPARLLLAAVVALIVPVALYQMGGGSSWKAEQDQYERFSAEAERRNHLFEGLRRAQDTISWIDYYYFENWRLPESIDDVRHGLPAPSDVGPTSYAFDDVDGTVTMFFRARGGVPDGEVSFTPTVDDVNKKLIWECWTPDLPKIERDLPSCVYEPPL